MADIDNNHKANPTVSRKGKIALLFKKSIENARLYS